MYKCGTKATETGQMFHAESVTLIANSNDETELIKLAVIKSSRFHAPKSLKDAPKAELSSEDRDPRQPDVDRMNTIRRNDPEHGEAHERES